MFFFIELNHVFWDTLIMVADSEVDMNVGG